MISPPPTPVKLPNSSALPKASVTSARSLKCAPCSSFTPPGYAGWQTASNWPVTEPKSFPPSSSNSQSSHLRPAALPHPPVAGVSQICAVSVARLGCALRQSDQPRCELIGHFLLSFCGETLGDAGEGRWLVERLEDGVSQVGVADRFSQDEVYTGWQSTRGLHLVSEAGEQNHRRLWSEEFERSS
jgi:hypothetical protein